MQQFDRKPPPKARENPCFRGRSPIPQASAYTWLMDYWPLFLVLALGLHHLQRQGQRRRTALLAAHLQPWQIERLMQRLVQGYQAALDLRGSAQDEAFAALEGAEQQLAQEFSQVAGQFSRLSPPEARTARLALPGLVKIWPPASFDTRRVLQVHAEGIARAVANRDGLAPRDRAFRLMAEMLLMQHSCHWFCRSRTVADARLLAQHQTHHAQALASVGETTRQDYLAIIRGPAVGA